MESLRLVDVKQSLILTEIVYLEAVACLESKTGKIIEKTRGDKD
jgi:hypothetical protein